jgi:putative ABC transport system permease protein
MVIMQDLRFGLRLLAANPGFAVVALLTLALGIGANTAIFSVIDTVLLRGAPVRDIDRLAIVWETDRNTGTTREPGSLPDYLDYRQRSQRVDQLAAIIGSEVNYAPDHGEPVRLQALEVTHDLLPMLGLTAAHGRSFTAEETREGGPSVVVLSDGFWTRAFGRDPHVVGRTIRIDDGLATVVGIMRPGADFGVYQILAAADYSRAFADRGARATVDVWLPFQYSPQSLPRSTHPLFMVARLRAGVAAVQEELTSIAADLERAYPDNRARGVFVEPLSAVVFGPVRPALLVLLAAVGLVLLVACVNVANLLLARGTARRREVAVRAALGASGWRLTRQFASEGLLLAVAATALGTAMAAFGVRGLVSLAPADIPRIADATVDLRVLGVALIVAIAAGLAFGMVPALQARRVDLQGALKAESGHGASAGRDRLRLRSLLVIAECALAVMLVVGAALLIKSFWRLHQVDPGFHSGGIVKAEYQLPRSRYPVDFRRFPDFKEMHAFTRAVLDRVQRLPGVDAVAVAGNHPLDPGFTNSFVIVGREAEAARQPEISVRRVTAGYFKTMGVGLVRGRLLGDSDTTTAAPVVLVNQATVDRFFADRDPIGQRIQFWGASRLIVGVVGNERFHGLDEAAPIALYAPLEQAPSASGAGALLVRTGGDPAAIGDTVRRAIREVDPALAVFGLEPLADTVSRSIAERRFTMSVLGLLAAVALLLAAIGVQGVLGCMVSERTREIGIRLALGAEPARVVREVVSHGLSLALTGAALGLGAAFGLTRAMRALLFETTPADPMTFVAVPALIVAVAVVASFLPARRATRVDPSSALRGD